MSEPLETRVRRVYTRLKGADPTYWAPDQLYELPSAQIRALLEVLAEVLEERGDDD